MSGSLSLMAGNALPAALSPVDGNAYEAGRKAAWDREDFASLFERHLAGAPAEAGADGGGQSSDTDRAARAAQAGVEDISATAPQTETGESTSAAQAELPLTADAWIPTVADGTARAACAATASDPETPLFEAQAPSAEPSSAGTTAGAGMRNDDGQVTVHIAGSEASVWARDPNLDATTAALLARDLRAQLSWRGVALTGLKLNGRTLTPLHEAAAVRPDPSVFGGEETNHGR